MNNWTSVSGLNIAAANAIFRRMRIIVVSAENRRHAAADDDAVESSEQLKTRKRG